MLSEEEWTTLGRKLKLTAREIDVLRGVCQEQTDDGIAATLGITTRTVRAHLESVYRKCHCRTRTGAVISVFKTLRRSEVTL